LKISQKLAKSA